MPETQTVPKVSKVELNNSITVEVNTTPEADTPTYSSMCEAFKNVALALNEVVYSATYLSDGGFGSSTVVGMAPTVTLTGDYIKGDAVCEYLDSIQYEIGSKRVSDIKLTRNGKVITCPITFSAIAIGGGESTAPNAISVTIAFNGKPTVTQASPTE